jgi:hypothetical protein
LRSSFPLPSRLDWRRWLGLECVRSHPVNASSRRAKVRTSAIHHAKSVTNVIHFVALWGRKDFQNGFTSESAIWKNAPSIGGCYEIRTCTENPH